MGRGVSEGKEKGAIVNPVVPPNPVIPAVNPVVSTSSVVNSSNPNSVAYSSIPNFVIPTVNPTLPPTPIPAMNQVPPNPTMNQLPTPTPNQLPSALNPLPVTPSTMPSSTASQLSGYPSQVAYEQTTTPTIDPASPYYSMFSNMDPNTYNYYTQMMYQMMQNPLLMQQLQQLQQMQLQMQMQMQLQGMNPAIPPMPSPPASVQSIPQRRPEEFTEDPVEDCKLFVGGMPNEVTETILRSYFQQFGPVRSVTVVRNRETGLSRGFGFVEFLSRIVEVWISPDF